MNCTCKEDKLPKHTCPYKAHAELNDKPVCHCCDHCKEQCLMDASEKLHGQVYIDDH